MDDAKRQAETLLRDARSESRELREQLETVQKEMKLQKSNLLLAIDEVKSSVQRITLQQVFSEGKEDFLSQESVSEAIRRKFTQLNQGERPE